MNYELIRRKFLFKAKEFYQEKDLQKFNINNKNIKFKSGSYMGRWFRENKKEIFKSNEDICKKIQEQYKRYRESLKKSFEERQKEKLSEFCKEENLEKFDSSKKKLRFKDNAYMGFWFAGNKKEIFKSSEAICKKIQEQYKRYRESLKKSFEERQKEKLSEFCKEENLEKFDSSKKKLRFKDNAYMGFWFAGNKKEIFKSNEDICKKIQEQYKEYRKNLKESTIKNNVEEFYQEKNLEKFNCNKKNIKFKNGNLMAVWFNNYKKEIFKSNEDICKKIQEQYKRYRESLKKSFEERQKEKLSEFCKEENLEKFNYNRKDIKFKNGNLMAVWFEKNKKEILNSDDEICLKILRQYYEYKDKTDMINYVDYKLEKINKGNSFVKQE